MVRGRVFCPSSRRANSSDVQAKRQGSRQAHPKPLGTVAAVAPRAAAGTFRGLIPLPDTNRPDPFGESREEWLQERERWVEEQERKRSGEGSSSDSDDCEP
jgi:hypothetical protein